MKKVLIVLLLIFGIVMSGFSRQFAILVPTYKSGLDTASIVTDIINRECRKGYTLVSITPITGSRNITDPLGSKHTVTHRVALTEAVILVFDDGKSEVNNEAGTR